MRPDVKGKESVLSLEKWMEATDKQADWVEAEKTQVQRACESEVVMVLAAGVTVFVILLMWRPPLITDSSGRIQWKYAVLAAILASAIAVLGPRLWPVIFGKKSQGASGA